MWSPYIPGSGCPCSPFDVVRVRFNDGEVQGGKAGSFLWGPLYAKRDIVEWELTEVDPHGSDRLISFGGKVNNATDARIASEPTMSTYVDPRQPGPVEPPHHHMTKRDVMELAKHFFTSAMCDGKAGVNRPEMQPLIEGTLMAAQMFAAHVNKVE